MLSVILFFFTYTKLYYTSIALLVSSYLFIMFGNDHNHEATNNTWVLDTTSWEWVTSVDKIEPAPPVKGPAYLPPDNDDNDDDGYVSPLEKEGPVIGSVIGSVIGLVCISYH